MGTTRDEGIPNKAKESRDKQPAQGPTTTIPTQILAPKAMTMDKDAIVLFVSGAIRDLSNP